MPLTNDMKLFRRQPKTPSAVKGLTRTEALAAIPRRSPSITWDTLDDGDVLIEYPLKPHPFFIQLARRFHKGPEQRLTKKLRLDRMGSGVWQMLDGKMEVRAIIRAVADQTGMSLQEAEISVTAFLRELGRRGLIMLG